MLIVFRGAIVARGAMPFVWANALLDCAAVLFATGVVASAAVKSATTTKTRLAPRQHELVAGVIYYYETAKCLDKPVASAIFRATASIPVISRYMKRNLRRIGAAQAVRRRSINRPSGPTTHRSTRRLRASCSNSGRIREFAVTGRDRILLIVCASRCSG